MSECEKRGCSYYWQDENEDYPICHYNDPIFPAPCEEEYDEPEPDDYDYCDDVDESNYDPYLGCDVYEFCDAADF